ncbi:hypothetical protein [Desulfonatronospira sp.]|nr:hypothetical protein [Desulfonatronospira sp.]
MSILIHVLTDLALPGFFSLYIEIAGGMDRLQAAEFGGKPAFA